MPSRESRTHVLKFLARTLTMPEIVFHISIDNDASSIEKYNACLTKQYLIDMR